LTYRPFVTPPTEPSVAGAVVADGVTATGVSVVGVSVVGDGVAMRAVDAVGVVTAAEAAAGVRSTDPMFPATAIPPATAATASATTAAAHGQRRRDPAALDGSSSQGSLPGRS
jgi:hypothetical protein